jgi:CHAT domain
MDYEYHIEVTKGDRVEVRGVLKMPTREDGRYGPVEIRPDPLRSGTIDVLRSWLNRWTAVRKTDYTDLPVPRTPEVLGQHLYSMLIQGAVKNGLDQARSAAEAARKPLRVLLAFDSAADDLAQLPWELLYQPGPDDSGDFLARTGSLVLSRRLLLESGVHVTTPKEPPLYVYFVVAVPDTEAYRSERDELLQSLEQPEEYTTSIQSKTLDRWDPEEIRQRLATPPYPHIVHIIGVCHRRWDRGEVRLELCVDDGAGRERWVDTDALLRLFDDDGSRDPEDRPRLVVLHLCEASPLDFEVTFERLAPRLIHRQIPAVLAMQYPVAGAAAQRFVRHLYEKLADRKSIEEAVRDARIMLSTAFNEDRLFGSPVLYMQSVDSELLPMRTGTPAGADAGPGSVSATGPPASSRQDFLLRVLEAQHPPPDLLTEMREFVLQTAWPQAWSDVERILTQKVREHASELELRVLFAAMVGAVQVKRDERLAS